MLLAARAALATSLTVAMTLVTGLSPAFADSFRPVKVPATTIQRLSAANRTPTPPAVSEASPLRIVAALHPQLDIRGSVWQPDAAYARGGTLTSTTRPIARTGSAVLYRHGRVGVSDYVIPVAKPATYFVDLFTSETAGAQPGQRVWTVSAEGKPTATVDVARDAGPATAYHVLFAVPVTDGTLNLHITPLVGHAVVDAVEVDYENDATTSTTLFDDEFTGAAGSSPDAAHWGYAEGGNGWGNNELESYTARPSNAALDGAGNLDIVARHENYTGSDGINRKYTSARLTTRNTFAFQYGTATARVKVPAGSGLLPAFWALGTNDMTAPWPLCGEMDIFENLGREPNIVYANVHAALNGWTPSSWLSGASATTAQPLADEYHTYGLVWGPNAVAMSLDGRNYFTLSSADMSPTSLWDFNHKFFLLLSLAVGGEWPGNPTGATNFPATMSVDYVRVTS
jgi:beta-glucanase (GH16 family)